jgi:hypothetical protein
VAFITHRGVTQLRQLRRLRVKNDEVRDNLKRKATDMADSDLHDQISDLESDIERFAESLDRCRKAMLFSKVVIAAGVISILAYLLGAIPFEPATMVGALAAIIVGVVVFGPNSSTSKQANAAMKAAGTEPSGST